MAGSKFDPNLFLQDSENVALHVTASELFGFLKRTLDLPPKWGALVRRTDGGQFVVPDSGVVDGTDAEDVLFIRLSPIELTLNEEGLTTGDRFQCSAAVRLRLSVIPERTELLSFLKTVVGSHRVVQAKGLVQYVQPFVRGALAKVSAERDAADLVGGGSSDAVAGALAEGMQGPLFSAGMMLEGAPTSTFDSRTLRQVRSAEQDASRRRAEHEAARQVQEALDRAQREHLDHLSTLLSRLGDMAAASPDVQLPELIRSFSERERGELYEALFASEPPEAQTRWIVVAAGDELLFFDPADLDSPTRRLTIRGDAGPIRSIQTVDGDDGRPILLLGAATGVYRLPIDRAEPDVTFLVDPAPPVRGGFNAAVTVGDRVFASHSELGLQEWRVGEPDNPTPRFESLTRQAGAVRGVHFFDGDLLCAIDDRIIRWPADDTTDKPAQVYTDSTSTITAVRPTSTGLFVGNGDGDVLHYPRDGDRSAQEAPLGASVSSATPAERSAPPAGSDGSGTAGPPVATGHKATLEAGSTRTSKPVRLHTGTNRPVESLWLLTTHGVRRLVYTDTSLHVHARVLGDTFACRYEAGGQTLRRVEVAPDLLVATNDLRDRLICWTPGRPASPSATIPVSRLCGRSIQDVCLVPRA